MSGEDKGKIKKTFQDLVFPVLTVEYIQNYPMPQLVRFGRILAFCLYPLVPGWAKPLQKWVITRGKKLDICAGWRIIRKR